MLIFSQEIQDFLKGYSKDYASLVAQIPKSRSSILIGDVLLFRYDLGKDEGSRDYRIVLVVKPVIKEPGTGNLLLTGVKVYPPLQITPIQMYDLYKNRDILPIDNYRTYRLNRIYGPLFRIATINEEK